MLVRAVVRHVVEQQPDAALMAGGNQAVHGGEVTEDGMDVAVVRYVVAEVGHRRGKGGRKPDRIDAKRPVAAVVQIVEPVDNPLRSPIPSPFES